MGNIFILAKFLHAEYEEKSSKKMVHGVFQKQCFGRSNFFVQKNYTNDGEKTDVMRGNTKSAVL